jgi:hypothetical protein
MLHVSLTLRKLTASYISQPEKALATSYFKNAAKRHFLNNKQVDEHLSLPASVQFKQLPTSEQTAGLTDTQQPSPLHIPI